ncbi:hypothetical protein J1605_017835 [Eschrichtius robustus]|uniref:Uncharacterized protein n=1 Tax=Eschrichtius robustus TaxID=9764 RepID=A0AB34I0F4_ESCRO|nr:hypothetical protein J1605_017835 [Eschrichtius robustus]
MSLRLGEGARRADGTQGGPRRAGGRNARGREPGARARSARRGGPRGARLLPPPRGGARVRGTSAAEGSAMEGALTVHQVSGAALGRVPKPGIYPAVFFAKVV